MFREQEKQHDGGAVTALSNAHAEGHQNVRRWSDAVTTAVLKKVPEEHQAAVLSTLLRVQNTNCGLQENADFDALLRDITRVSDEAKLKGREKSKSDSRDTSSSPEGWTARDNKKSLLLMESYATQYHVPGQMWNEYGRDGRERMCFTGIVQEEFYGELFKRFDTDEDLSNALHCIVAADESPVNNGEQKTLNFEGKDNYSGPSVQQVAACRDVWAKQLSEVAVGKVDIIVLEGAGGPLLLDSIVGAVVINITPVIISSFAEASTLDEIPTTKSVTGLNLGGIFILVNELGASCVP
jgi:hypothetical protein